MAQHEESGNLNAPRGKKHRGKRAARSWFKRERETFSIRVEIATSPTIKTKPLEEMAWQRRRTKFAHTVIASVASFAAAPRVTRACPSDLSTQHAEITATILPVSGKHAQGNSHVPSPQSKSFLLKIGGMI
jgi:hypothetical protein